MQIAVSEPCRTQRLYERASSDRYRVGGGRTGQVVVAVILDCRKVLGSNLALGIRYPDRDVS
jgi:hypothetical protein